MTYKCPKCDHASEQAGNCPTCNVPMVESSGEGSAPTGTPETPPQS